MSGQPDGSATYESGASGSATYAFAVCRAVDAAALTALPGLVPGTPVRPLPFGTLTAVVQHVPRGDFDEERLRKRLADPQELERCARAHHEVVSAVADHGPTVPLALATLYLSDERAQRSLAADSERFLAVLRRVEAHEEWGVKVYAPAVRDVPASTGSAAGDGRAYLERRRTEQRARELRHQDAARVADQVDDVLRGMAAAARRLRPHAAAATGDGPPQVLNAAYLIARGREAELMRTVQALRGRTGARIEVCGPWVAYSFAGLPEAADTVGAGA